MYISMFKGKRTLGLLVENCGRVNYGKTLDEQRKGTNSKQTDALYTFQLAEVLPEDLLSLEPWRKLIKVHKETESSFDSPSRSCRRYSVERAPPAGLHYSQSGYEAKLCKQVCVFQLFSCFSPCLHFSVITLAWLWFSLVDYLLFNIITMATRWQNSENKKHPVNLVSHTKHLICSAVWSL